MYFQRVAKNNIKNPLLKLVVRHTKFYKIEKKKR